MKKGYYQADIDNGVSFYDTTMDFNVEILSADEFYNKLECLCDEETIYGFFDDFGTHDMEVLSKIEKKYGIN